MPKIMLIEDGKSKKLKTKKKKVAKKKKKQRAKPVKSVAISVPVAKAMRLNSGAPKVSALSRGDSRVVHSEYIGDLIASTGSPTAFGLVQVQLNPGLAGAFPWLSSVAQNYESYRFNSLSLRYETSAITSLGGSMGMFIDFDPNDGPPINKVQSLSNRNAVRSVPWNRAVYHAVKEDLHKRSTYAVRTGSVSADIGLYDTGNWYIFTQGVTTASAVCGELWIDYDVTLMTPTVLTPDAALAGGTVESAGGSASPSNPLGNVPYFPDMLGVVPLDGKHLYFEYPGAYLIDCVGTGTNLLPGDVTIFTGNNGATTYTNASIGNAGTSSTSRTWSFWVTIPAFGTTLAVSFVGFATTLTDLVIRIGKSSLSLTSLLLDKSERKSRDDGKEYEVINFPNKKEMNPKSRPVINPLLRK